MAEYIVEPFRIKVIEAIKKTTREERQVLLAEAGYNPLLLRAEDVYIDLLTDSGTAALSDNQWAGLVTGDESYAGCKNFYNLQEVVKTIFGFEHFVPTHQGRPAERILFTYTTKSGDHIPSNMFFDSTRAHVEIRGAHAADLIVDEGLDPQSQHPFKGNIDLVKLEHYIEEVGADKIPLAVLTVTNNTGGGQPVSMENIRATKAVLAKYGIPLYFDAARYAENAYFIKEREQGYEDKTPLEIANEMFSYAEGCTMSGKKDGLVNIGGLLAMNDEGLYQQACQDLILTEGYPTYGGLAGRDLEALARGLMEALDEEYLRYRVGQVRYLGDRLLEAGVPIVEPTGGHAIYLDAKRFLPHIPQAQFPGQALNCHLYLEGGIRGIEIGSVMFAREDEETGEMVYPQLELVRLALPRRVYTQSHLDCVADTIITLYQKRDRIKGMCIVYEPPLLRHFTARFDWVS